MDWAFETCLESYAARSRKTLYCLECGHSWKDESVLVSAMSGCTCPNCGKELKEKQGQNAKDSAYFAIITAIEGVQVVRMFWVQKDFHKGTAAYSWTSEVMQHFIFNDGKVITLAKQVQGLSRYYDQWIHNSELQVRTSGSYQATLRYDLGPYKIYPDRKVIPELKRNGFTGHFYDFTPHKFLSLLLSIPAAETLLKSRQMNMLRHLSLHPKEVEDCWPSIRICIRNNYMIKDASLWCDYIGMLGRFGKDLRNSHYVCPVDLRAAHDRYVKKQKALDKAKKLEELKADIDKAQIKYEKKKQKYFGIMFQEQDLTVKVLEHVSEFFEEGHEHGHCVFASQYYNKENSLVLSARVNDKPVETVELSLSQMKIVQARGKGNAPTKYHSRILNLVNSNLHEIQNAMQKSVSV